MTCRSTTNPILADQTAKIRQTLPRAHRRRTRGARGRPHRRAVRGLTVHPRDAGPVRRSVRPWVRPRPVEAMGCGALAVWVEHPTEEGGELVGQFGRVLVE